MCAIRLILYILLIVLVILIATIFYLSRYQQNVVGGNVEQLYEWIGELRQAIASKTYDKLDDSERERINNIMLNVVNKIADTNLTFDQINEMVKNGGWKVLLTRIMVKLAAMPNDILSIRNLISSKIGGVVDWAAMAIIILVILQTIIVGVITLAGIILPAAIGVFAIGTSASLSIAFFATIYSILGMYFNASIRRQALSQMDQNTLAREGVELATKDVSSEEMREFMSVSLGDSNTAITSMASGTLGVIGDVGKSSIDVVGNVGSTALGATMSFGEITGGDDNCNPINIFKSPGSFIEMSSIINDYFINYNAERGAEIVALMYDKSKIADVLESASQNPATAMLYCVLITITMLNKSLLRNVQTS